MSWVTPKLCGPWAGESASKPQTLVYKTRPATGWTVMVGEIHLCSQPKRDCTPGCPPPNRTVAGPRGGAVGSPLRSGCQARQNARGVGRTRPRWRRRAPGAEAEAAEGVSAEHNLRGLRVHNLAAWPHRAGGERHCGAGGHGTQGTVPGPPCQSPPTLGGTAWESERAREWEARRSSGGAKSAAHSGTSVVGSSTLAELLSGSVKTAPGRPCHEHVPEVLVI